MLYGNRFVAFTSNAVFVCVFLQTVFFLLLSKTKGKPALTLIIEDNNIISKRKVVKRFF